MAIIMAQQPMRPNASPIAFLLMFAILLDVFTAITQEIAMTNTLQSSKPTFQKYRIFTSAYSTVKLFPLFPQYVKQGFSIH